jgi:hypothetical protein
MSSIPDNMQPGHTPSGGYGAVLHDVLHDLSLSFIQLRLHSRSYHETRFRHTDAIDVVAGAGEGDLKISRIGAEERLIQPVIEHLIAHSPKAAAALFDAVEVGETLGQNGITRAGAVLALAQTGERDRRGRKAGAGDDNPVGENFEHDLAAGVLVLPMGRRVDESFPQSFRGILIEAHTVQADHFHWMAGVSVDERYGAIDGEGHRPAYVLVVARIAVGFGASVSVGQNATLRKDRRRIFRQQHDTSRGREVFAGA